MKFNWSHGITIGIILFMAYILFLVFKISSLNTDLYAKDYYQQEVDFQTSIDAKANMNLLSEDISIVMSDKILNISLPQQLPLESLDGTLYFFRPENAKLDKHFQVDTTNHLQQIPKNSLVAGNYILKIRLECDGKKYFKEMALFVNN